MESAGEVTQAEQKLLPELRITLAGKKPACYIPINSVTSTQIQEFRRAGFECIETKVAYGEEPEPTASLWTIAKVENIESLLKPEIIDTFRGKFPQLAQRLAKVIGELNGTSIAQALAFLSEYPRIDHDFPQVSKNNLERPEIAIVTGLLLGYPLLDVDYYLRTRYLGEPMEIMGERVSEELTYIRDPHI